MNLPDSQAKKESEFNSVDNILLNLPSSFFLSNNHLAEILLAGKLNLWEVDLIKNEIYDFGYSESLSIRNANDQLPGNLDIFYSRLHPLDLERVRSSFETCLKTQEDFGAEFRINMTNGNCEWIEARGRSIKDHTNKTIKMVGTWRFITYEKKAQEMLRTQQSTLNRLSRAYFVGELASTVSHEISQPIAAINTYVSASLRRLRENDMNPSELISALEVSEHHLGMVNKIIARIKSFIIDGEIQKNKVDIRTLVKGAIKLIRFTHGNIVDIKSKFEEHLPTIEADPYQIKQVLYSLINNAINAMNRDEITEPKVLIQVDILNQMMNIHITDNGRGISEENKKWLFMPFFTTKENGMGLGLAICRKIIEAHHGAISITQYKEQGTACSVSLPLI